MSGGSGPAPVTPSVAQRYRWVTRLCAGAAAPGVVATRARIRANPEAVWRRLLLYEEVPAPPPALLHLLLPRPLRTEGDKTRLGAVVRCVYREGELWKRITRVEPPRRLEFDVVAQRMGVERCFLARGGSYQIRARGAAAEIVLTTQYQACLHPRWIWRPLEALLAHALHRHILAGVRHSLPTPAAVPAAPART